jgi:hypothetical protein
MSVLLVVENEKAHTLVGFCWHGTHMELHETTPRTELNVTGQGTPIHATCTNEHDHGSTFYKLK